MTDPLIALIALIEQLKGELHTDNGQPLNDMALHAERWCPHCRWRLRMIGELADVVALLRRQKEETKDEDFYRAWTPSLMPPLPYRSHPPEISDHV